MILALAVVALLAAGVAWLLYRIAFEISRFDDWDQPIAKRKRESWK